MNIRLISTAALLFALGGCYHATIETGRTPSTTVIDRPWASSWVYGLVPPPVVQTAQQCPGGVAKVETKLTFTNQLVGFLTGGIYTPMAIRVTCAQGEELNSEAVLQAGSDAAAAVNRAAALAANGSGTMLVRFSQE